MFSLIKHKSHALYQRWLSQRIPAQTTHTLNNRKIFIFLSKAGCAYCCLLLLILVIAINYQNNMVFLLLFLLCSLFVVVLIHSYNNFNGLKIDVLKANNAFAGDSSEVRFRFSSSRQASHAAIRCCVGHSELVFDVPKFGELEDSLHVYAKHRGVLIAPRLLVESFYPFGLFRVWSWLPIVLDAVVYPKPIKNNKLKLTAEADDDGGDISIGASGDEFNGFKNYQKGDSLKKVHWPGYAKGQPMQIKEYGEQMNQDQILNLNDFDGGLEQRLSKMCYWVIKYNKSQEFYSVIINGSKLGAGKSQEFTDSILKQLALYRNGE